MSIEHVGNQVWPRAKPGGYEQLRMLEVYWIFWAGLFSLPCGGASRRWGEGSDGLEENDSAFKLG